MNLNPLSFFTKSEAPAVEQKQTLDEALATFLGWLGFKTSSGVSVTTETSIQVPAVFCAARVIAEGVAAMPIELKSKSYDEKKQRYRTKSEHKHWAHDLMANKPNDWQTPGEFIEGMTFCAAIAGEALAMKVLVDKGRRVYELIPIIPSAWSVEVQPDLKLLYRVSLENGEYYELSSENVLHLRGPSLNGYSGLKAVNLAKEAIGLSSALEKQQAKLSGAGGKPSGVLSFVNKLEPEQKQKLKAAWEKNFGPNGEGGIAILDGETKFHQMTMSSVDSQTLESRRFQVEEVARAFRVLPLMIMQADKASTFASVEQMSRMHVTHTLMPWVRRWEQALNRDILSRDKVLYFDFDETLLLRGDHKDQGEFFQKALGAGGTPGFMSINEVREQMGLVPVDEEWADEIPQGSMSENLKNAPSPLQEENGDD